VIWSYVRPWSCNGLGLGLAFGGLGFAFDGLGLASEGLGLAFDGIGFDLASESLGFAFDGLGLAFDGLGLASGGLGLAFDGLGLADVASDGLGLAFDGLGLASEGLGLAFGGLCLGSDACGLVTITGVMLSDVLLQHQTWARDVHQRKHAVEVPGELADAPALVQIPAADRRVHGTGKEEINLRRKTGLLVHRTRRKVRVCGTWNRRIVASTELEK